MLSDEAMVETRYAKSGDVNVAYQVAGEGPVDVVFVPGWVSHVEHGWEEPSYAPFLERIMRFARLILFDRPGTGLSDPVDSLPTLEERMDTVRAVMDAAGSEKAVLFGISEGGAMCILFAATYPERCASLVLCNSFAFNQYSDDYPWGPTPEIQARLERAIEKNWGTGFTPRLFAPSRAEDEAFVRAWAKFERRAVSPGAMKKITAMGYDTDVRAVLPSIRVPTLVVHRTGDLATPVEGGRYLAEHIPGAKYLELPGVDHFPWIGDTDAILDEVELFATGARQTVELDRILATVFFVDIVGSTEKLAELGDRRWRELLTQFYTALREQLVRFRGREIDSAGDGVFATFDGPARAIRCAGATIQAVRSLGIEVRVGIHTGECEVLGDKVSGIAVHLGARVCGRARANETLVSSTVRDLVAGSGLNFADRGSHTLRGVPGEWHLYAVEAD
jgi:pimeloyl-ACP methyl ester carboxylesterase